MLNQFVLVGRIKEIKGNEENGIVTLAIPQTFKNVNGEYDTNYIDCYLYKGIAEQTQKYCDVGTLIGVKGRLQKLENDNELKVIAEKVTFLSSKETGKDEE